MEDREVVTRLTRLEGLLESLLLLIGHISEPIAAEEARQLLTASPEQRRAHNKAVLTRAKTAHAAGNPVRKR